MLKRIFLVLSILVFSATAIVAQGTSTSSSTKTETATTTKKPPVFRPTKDQIKQVQTILKEKTLYKGEATGVYNDDTRAGIKSFQKDNGLSQTGTLNRATLEKFGVELTASQKEIPVSESSFASSAKSTSSSVASTVAKGTKTAASATTDAVKTAGSATADGVKTAASATSDGVKTAANATTNALKKPAPFRANADQIKAAQKLLKDGKMYSGEETGKLDDPTREGLGKYQDANGLKVTKTLNAVTLEKMGIALTDAQKANVAAQAEYDAAKKN